MSESEKPAKKPGKMKKILLLTVLVLGIGGGGVGAGLYAGGMLPGTGGHAKPKVDPNLPHLVAREGTSEAEAAKYQSEHGDKSPDPKKFKASYYPLENNFTVNLRDTDGFIQMGLGVSTYYDERVLENIKAHEMAIRSAILLHLSDQDSLALATPAGKDQLRAELKKSINGVLKAKEGFGGVDDVYFTSLVMQ
ncbi:flagellar basal body-associated FliL family protein [Allosphingosinicella flava]|uniref:Flagellar protein FliL n=1 Tax=Allosphingosinicella flava TaxID=2771430 RepID=A0A7T2GK56_9SPHN|nr:flagellar basal body-associated FliL family protein [Sphingosinicella flava]QPQ55356.1 flagellar basal body-associated FliL family protein [Sphingosinicella flava]